MRAIHDLRNVWLGDDPLMESVKALESLIPGHLTMIYRRKDDGTLGSVAYIIEGQAGQTWDLFPETTSLTSLTRYNLASRDPLAHRPVGFSELYGEDQDSAQQYRHTILAPHGFWSQLRMTVYHQDRFMAWCGFLRPKGQPDFRSRSRRLLSAVAPLLCDGLVTMRALGRADLSPSVLGNILDALSVPAFLVNGRGDRVHANPRADELFASIPDWLPLASRCDNHPRVEALARVSQLDVEGESLWLVLPRSGVGSSPSHARSISLESLTPRLRRVAALLTEGRSDKEIAVELEIEVSTARTYVTRVFRRLGVHHRRELIASFGTRGA
jgi:DNA-binding CsgD family transcriptional regulator